jgi:hypothetical protein
MTRAYSLDLRERVIAMVDDGETTRTVAAAFDVSVASVVKWVHRARATGSAARAVGGFDAHDRFQRGARKFDCRFASAFPGGVSPAGAACRVSHSSSRTFGTGHLDTRARYFWFGFGYRTRSHRDCFRAWSVDQS